MFSPRSLLNFAIGFHAYIWVDVCIIKETPKAILIMFDGRKIWLPKAWIVRIKRNCHRETSSIKISEYHWSKKSQEKTTLILEKYLKYDIILTKLVIIVITLTL